MVVSSYFRKLSFVVLCLVFVFGFSVSVFASDFFVSQSPIVYRISPDGSASYNVSIVNLGLDSRVFSVGLGIGDSADWVSYPSGVSVLGSSEKFFVFNVVPKPGTPIGVYQLALEVRSQGVSDVIPIPLHMSFDGLFSGYVPNVGLSVSDLGVVNPRDDVVRVRVDVENRNPLVFDELELRVSSDVFSKSEVFFLGPGPLNVVSKEFVFQLSPIQRPGEYVVSVDLFNPKSEEVISRGSAVFVVDKYSSIPRKHEFSRSWFLVTHEVFVENFGNHVVLSEVRLGSDWFKKLFSYSEPRAEFVRDGDFSGFEWVVSLEPTESKILVVKTNYRPLVVILVLALLALLAYFYFRSPVVVSKKGFVMDDHHGEGSSDLKIRIFLKNRSRSIIHNISVIDKVPGITELVETSQLGYVKPSRVTKTAKKGTVAYWDVDVLEPFEERILTYKLKSKLKVVGDLSLPRVRVKFDSVSGGERNVFSDTPVFNRVKPKKND